MNGQWRDELRRQGNEIAKNEKTASGEKVSLGIDILALARGIAAIVRDVGVPVAVLAVMFLIYIGILPSPLTALADQHTTMQNQNTKILEQHDAFLRRAETLSKDEGERTRLLRLICKRLSRTNGDECD